jgi:hypothetical protein
MPAILSDPTLRRSGLMSAILGADRAMDRPESNTERTFDRVVVGAVTYSVEEFCGSR